MFVRRIVSRDCIDETDSPTLARLSVFEQDGWMEFLAQTRDDESPFSFTRLLTLPTEDDSLDSSNYMRNTIR